LARSLQFVGQSAMDKYYQEYKSDNDYWDIDDFIAYVGENVSAFYQKIYDQKYAELRQEGKDEIVDFDISLLSQAVLDVDISLTKKKSTAKVPCGIMTFMGDNQNSGIQMVRPSGTGFDCEFERCTMQQLWALNYMPFTKKIWFTFDGINLQFTTSGICQSKKVIVYYVPSFNPKMQIPDGIVSDVIAATILTMRKEFEGQTVKKTLDLNQNQPLQAEVNKNALK